jgi:hypothetical protein
MRPFALEIVAGSFAPAAGHRRIVPLDLAEAIFSNQHIGLTEPPRSLTKLSEVRLAFDLVRWSVASCHPVKRDFLPSWLIARNSLPKRAYYPRPRRTGTGLRPRPLSVSLVRMAASCLACRLNAWTREIITFVAPAHVVHRAYQSRSGIQRWLQRRRFRTVVRSSSTGAVHKRPEGAARDQHYQQRSNTFPTGADKLQVTPEGG